MNLHDLCAKQALKMKKPGDPDLYAPGQSCEHKCNEECLGIGCKDCKRVRSDCNQVQGTKLTSYSRLEWSEGQVLFSVDTRRLENLR